MAIGERIRRRRKQLGLTVDEVAQALGKNRATVYRYESNEIENLPTTVLEPLAAILRTTPAQLMGWSTQEPRITDLKDVEPLPGTYPVPLIGSIACGTPILAVENVEDRIPTPENIDADFCLICRGDSMIGARIRDGDIVYIRQQEDVDNGEIAAVLIDEEVTLKRVYRQRNQLILQPENPKYGPMVYSAEDGVTIRILGKAVAFMSSLRSV